MQNRKILVGISILILLIGLTIQEVVAKEIGEEAIVAEDSLIEDSITAVPSTQTYTGCLTTIGRWNMPKGVMYYVRLNSTPSGACLSGDVTISFVKKDYINTLEARIAKSESKIVNAEARIAKLEKLLTNVTRSGNNIYFNRANVHIRSGSGKTDGTVNGLGNLIVGYNELRTTGNYRTGSHNIIVGTKNNFNSFGGIVAGLNNELSGQYSSVTGGIYVEAAGFASSVSGGNKNIASGDYSSVTGGLSNTASHQYSSVSGGANNIASNYYSSISGGWYNVANGSFSSVSGGNSNTASGFDSSVSGGYSNTASGSYSSVSGGRENTASGHFSSVSGGMLGHPYGLASSISGGYNNIVNNDYYWIAGHLLPEQ
jgi:hypothetical protein